MADVQSPPKTPPRVRTSKPEKAAKRARLGEVGHGESGPGKDANAPKRPPAAYWIFASEKREALFEELGTKKVAAVAKRTAEIWKEMGADDKMPYEAKAAAAKMEHEKAKEEYDSKRPAPEADAAPTQAQSPAKTTPAKIAPKAQASKRPLPAAVARDDVIDAKVLKKAGDFADALRNLASRPEATGKSAQELLSAIRKCNGFVNKAKALLCSGA